MPEINDNYFGIGASRYMNTTTRSDLLLNSLAKNLESIRIAQENFRVPWKKPREENRAMLGSIGGDRGGGMIPRSRSREEAQDPGPGRAPRCSSSGDRTAGLSGGHGGK